MVSAKRTIERRWLRQNAQSQGFFVGADVLGGPCMSRHTQSERIGDFAGCTNSPILFSCLSPMPPGGDKPPPLRQRRRCGANIHGDARIRPGAAGILRRFQLRSHDAPSGSRLRAAWNHLPRRGRQRRPTPAGRADALGGPIRLPVHRKVDRRREANELKSGRPMVGPTGVRPGHVWT